jgi:protein-L-isoaspartate(D-aspartate) O-methyltransferase
MPDAIGTSGMIGGEIWPGVPASAALPKMDETLSSLLSSLQRNGISDSAVLDAIARTPRDAFISEEALKPRAYADEALPIECEQTISQPFIVAYMTERLHVLPEHDVLEVGTGSGYQTAILARIARHVYTIERHLSLLQLAVQRFEQLHLDNVTAVQGDGTKGWPEARQFDRIIVTAAAKKAPKTLLDQLVTCGAMIIPLGGSKRQRLTLITRNNGHVESQPLLPVRFVPLVPRDDRQS